MSKWEIMQRVADTRKEIETFAQDWADVPGGTRNPLAVADWERLWRQLDELFAALGGKPCRKSYRIGLNARSAGT